MLSTHRFDPIRINIDEFVCGKKRFNAWPEACEQGVKISAAQIAETQMHHPRRRRCEHDAMRKISVFGYDDELIRASMLPER